MKQENTTNIHLFFQGNCLLLWKHVVPRNHETLGSLCWGALTHVIHSHQQAAIRVQTHLSVVLACSSANPMMGLPSDLIFSFWLLSCGKICPDQRSKHTAILKV